MSPIILAVASLVFSLFFSLLAFRTRHAAGFSSALVNTIGGMLLICAFGIWCAASIAGAGMDLAHAVITCCGAAMIALTLVLLFSLQSTDGDGQLTVVTARVLATVRGSEWVRALLVYCGSPLLGFYLVFAFLNQVLRKLGASCGADRCVCKPVDRPSPSHTLAAEHGILGAQPAPRLDQVRAWVNSAAASVLEDIYESDRKSQVLGKVMLLGVLAWATMFGSTVTFIGLAWLIELLKTLPLYSVCLLFVAIGFVMFLIPVVPGLAVYLCGGILIVQVARDQGFGGSGERVLSLYCQSISCWSPPPTTHYWHGTFTDLLLTTCPTRAAMSTAAHIVYLLLLTYSTRTRTRTRTRTLALTLARTLTLTRCHRVIPNPNATPDLDPDPGRTATGEVVLLLGHRTC